MDLLSLPTAIAAAALAVPALLLLYFLKRRRRRVVVSTTLLWLKTIQDLQASSPFQKLRRNLLLLLQLLVLLGLLGALARPTLPGVVAAGRRVIILIDHSASMNATDVVPSRLARAKAAAVELIEGLTDDPETGAVGGAMVVSFSEAARVVEPWTTDRGRLRRAVASIEPTDLPTKLGPAARLIEPYTRGVGQGGGSGVTVYVISDGRVQDRQTVAAVGGAWRYVRVGESAENLGIVSLAARRESDDPRRVRVFARLANGGDGPVTTNVSLFVNGRVQRVVPVAVGGGEGGRAGALRFTLSVPLSAVIELRHDHVDSLEADNSAWLILTPPRRVRVLLVTNGNRLLEQAIRAAGATGVVRVSPGQYERGEGMRASSDEAEASGGDGGFDAVVFDRHSPRVRPGVNSLYFNAAPPVEGLALVGRAGGGDRTELMLDWRRDHPIMRYVSLDGVLVRGSGRLSLPGGAVTLATGQSGPAVVLVSDRGTQHVVVGFDPLHSNWPMQVGFPVFMKNVLGWLSVGGRSGHGSVVRPGQAVAVPVGRGVESLVYEGPVRVAAALTGANGAAVVAFDRVGYYAAEPELVGAWGAVGVSLLDPLESRIGPVDEIDMGGQVVAGAGEAVAARQEIWRWFVWAALVGLLVEWVVYARRLGV